jgi:hypothetical protein
MTVRTAGFKWWHLIPWLDLFGDTWSYFRWPHTVAAVRIPEATGSLHGLHVARRSERFGDGGELWQQHELVAADWVPVSRKRADPAVVEQVLLGPVQDALMPRRELGFTIEFMYGQLLVYQQGFLTDPGQLDAFCHAVSSLARGIREICAPAPTPQPFETELPPPEWLPKVESLIDERHVLYPQGAWMERIVQIGRDRGWVVEDPLSFHRAFPQLPVPGEAFGVLRREDGMRLLCCLERSMNYVGYLKKVVHDPGGPVGANAAVLPAPGVSDSPDGVDGVLADSHRYAVRDGVKCVWTKRDTWQASGEPLDELAAAAPAIGP